MNEQNEQVVGVRKKSVAFSLIELLVVMAIILVLAGIIFGIATSVIQNANKAKAASDVKTLVAAVDTYFTFYGKRLTCGNGAGMFDPDSIIDALMGGDGRAGRQDGDHGISDSANDCGADDGFTTNLGSANPKKIVFLSFGSNELCNYKGESRSYVFLDPWGSGYNYAIDSNSSGVIDTGDYMWTTSSTNPGANGYFSSTCGGNQGGITGTWNGIPNLRRYMIVWSNGPDKKNGFGNPDFDCGGGVKCGKDDITAWSH